MYGCCYYKFYSDLFVYVSYQKDAQSKSMAGDFVDCYIICCFVFCMAVRFNFCVGKYLMICRLHYVSLPCKIKS